jgi:hypothetical protein
VDRSRAACVRSAALTKPSDPAGARA